MNYVTVNCPKNCWPLVYPEEGHSTEDIVHHLENQRLSLWLNMESLATMNKHWVPSQQQKSKPNKH